jgi:hypothetical protein
MQFGVQVNCDRTECGAISDPIVALGAGRRHGLWLADHCLPPPGCVQQPHVPITAGGTGDIEACQRLDAGILSASC